MPPLLAPHAETSDAAVSTANAAALSRPTRTPSPVRTPDGAAGAASGGTVPRTNRRAGHARRATRRTPSRLDRDPTLTLARYRAGVGGPRWSSAPTDPDPARRSA